MKWNELIIELKRNFRLSELEIAVLCGITYTTLNKIRRGLTEKPNQNTIKLLENGLKIKINDSNPEKISYEVVPQNYTWPLSFWKRGIKFLKTANKISDEYSLKQIRPTLASFLINILKLDIYTVKKLLDHSDVKVTDKHYVDFDVNSIRKEMDDIDFDRLLNGN